MRLPRSYAGFLLAAIACVVAPLVVYPIFLMKVLCLALFASAFHLLLGYAGLLSFGHAMFFGTAAYAAAHAAKVWSAPPEVAILFGTAVGASMGVVVGAIAIRRQGIYFAMITLGLAQLNYFVCLQAPFTGGENALQAVPRGRALGVFDMNNMTVLYAAVLVIFWAGFFVIHRTIHSPMGEVLKAIRDHEPRALSLGYEADHYKLIAFSLSAALAALAGSTKAIVFQLASLTDVHWTTSGEVILMTLIGGLGRVSGPLIGAFIMVTLEQYLAPLGAWGPVVQGGIFVSCVMTFREGIMGVASKLLRRPGRTHHPRAELTSDVGDQ